ncbi:MAG: hypothetical protein EBX40_05570 [Gammaproteobacteria bacterium]|nr:hypothetical protein [Gammaproteobacteria bacterium]
MFPPIAAAAALKGAFVGLVTKIGLLGSFAAFAANFAYYGIGKIGEFKLGVKGLVRAMLGLKSGEQVLEATKSKDVAPAPSRESSQGSAVDAGKHRASHVVLVATDAKQAEGSVAEVKDARKPGCRGRFAGSFYRGSAPVAPAPAPALTPTAEPSAENKEQGGNRSRSSSAGVLHGNPAANAHDSAQMQTVRDENDLDIV